MAAIKVALIPLVGLGCLLLACATLSPPARAAGPQPGPGAITGLRVSQVTGSGGVPINVVETGDPTRPAIVFIHGYRQSYLSWIRQFRSSLASRCHLIAYDLRGHGNSGAPWQAEAYSDRKAWAEDLAAVLTATGARRPMIVAWSFGGDVAMDYLRYHRRPGWSRLVLVGSEAGMFEKPQAPEGAPPRPNADFDLDRNIEGAKWSARLLFGDTLDPALAETFVAASMRVSPFVDRGIVPLGRTTNTDLLPDLDVPVTLVFGGEDIVVPPARAHQVAALFPGARRETFEHSHHAPFLEDPERFNALLEAAQCTGS